MSSIPTEHNDPINSKILAVSEDLIEGFYRQPFHQIATNSQVPLETVLERIRAMLEAKVIRRVRQTLLSTKLAHGALVAWQIPEEKLNEAFDFMSQNDPFSGHIVIRSTDHQTTKRPYRLWTTLKVPQGESLEQHASVLKKIVGAKHFVLMPAKGVFTLGVGHIRRRNLPPGSKFDQPAKMMPTIPVRLEPQEWKILLSLKEELNSQEIIESPWENRSKKLGISTEEYCQIAETLHKKKVIGRFSTFLEHVKPSSEGQRVTRFNALFHWAVPKGQELIAGSEVGRHHCMTHCYWREAGNEFNHVNIMGVIHGTQKEAVLAHKQAIDEHLAKIQIPVSYTNVFWGGRSEIYPSEISPKVYQEWHKNTVLLKIT